MRSADEWVKSLQLLPHPEGGFYRETYRSNERIAAEGLPARYGAARCFGTSIYYLLRSGDRSRFHRLKSDEIWHYHAGGVAAIHLLHADGRYERQLVGDNPSADQALQVILPHGCWFGATVEQGGYILVGCAVSPGFDFADFEIGERDALLKAYPGQGEIIRRLT